MSLAVLADHMASKGRGPDSMLIHMSPREVQGLQALAVQQGGSLTINPETGLPEAGFLDKLLPTIIGVGLSMAGVPPHIAAMMVGGAETVRTGDLGKGISAGLGAYGGAGLGAGMGTAGAEAIGSQAAGQSYLSSYVPPGVLEGAGAGLSADMAYNLGQAGVVDAASTQAVSAAQQAAAGAVEAASPFDKMSRGFDVAKANPSSLLTKDNFKYLGAAAAPILADQAVKSNLPTTATKLGMIRPYSYDPYGGTYTAGTPYEAQVKKVAGGGLMGMNDGGYSPGQLDFTQRSEPVVRMAKGGVAHFAAGGDAALAAYQAGNYGEASRLLAEAGMSAQDVVSKYGLSQADAATVAQNLGYTGDMSGLQYAAPPPVVQAAAPVVQAAEAPVVQAAAAPVVQAATAAPTYTQYTNEQIGSYLAANPTADITAATKATNADPAAVNAYIASLTSPFVGSTLDTRGSGTLGIYNQLTAQGIDPNEYYAAATANDPKYAGWSLADIKRGYKLDEGAYALSKKLSGNVSDKDWVKFMDEGGYSVNDMAQAFGLSTREVQARYDAAKTKTTTPIVCGPGYRLNAAGTACEPIPVVPPIVNPPITYVPTPTDISTAINTALPPGVSGAGITTVNPNGTITTRPNIPGIPEGGFTGMANLRDVYEKGGGSLGVNKNLFVPKTQDELFARYKNTGGSKAAFDYLMGKTPYSPTPYTPTGEIMKPYFESVGRFPENRKAKKYVFVNGKYQLNPDYVKPSYVLAGEKAAADKAAAEEKAKTVEKDVATTVTGQNDGGGGGDANGGLMKLARGGMSQQFNLGDYSDGGRLLRGPGDGISDSIPASIGGKRPARLADGEFVVPARIVSELGNGSTEAGARKLYAMMDRVQKARRGTVGKGKVAKNSRSDKYLPA